MRPRDAVQWNELGCTDTEVTEHLAGKLPTPELVGGHLRRRRTPAASQ